MKLLIIKNQAAGFLGGINFVVNAKVELTQEEHELVKKYRAGDQILLETVSVWGPVKWTINDLQKGIEQKGKNVSEILAIEELLKSACKQFRLLLDIMNNFGGEEHYEF